MSMTVIRAPHPASPPAAPVAATAQINFPTVVLPQEGDELTVGEVTFLFAADDGSGNNIDMEDGGFEVGEQLRTKINMQTALTHCTCERDSEGDLPFNLILTANEPGAAGNAIPLNINYATEAHNFFVTPFSGGSD